MRRFCNFRPIVLLCLSFSIGILSFYLSLYLHIIPAILLLFMPVIAGVTTMIFNRKRAKSILLIAFACQAVLLLGFFNFSIRFNARSLSYFELDCTVNARFTEAVDYKGGYRLYFDDACFSADGTTFTNESFFVDSADNFGLKFGDTVSFSGSVYANEAFVTNGTPDAYYLSQDIRFDVYSDFADLEITGSKLNLFERVKIRLCSVAEKHMSKDGAALLVAMMFGSKTEMDPLLLSSMRSSGIAHIFAVSGLHVGFIAGMIHGLLNRLKVKGLFNYIPSVLLTFFYCGMCGFSSSSLRALLMFSLYLLFKISGLKYDMLKSTLTSSVIILLIDPRQILSYGFILSYSAVLSLCLLKKPIFRLVKFLPDAVADNLSTVLAAQVGLLGLSVYFFRYAPIFALFINFIMVPLISVLFKMSAVTLLLSLIPACGKVFMFIPDMLLSLVVRYFSYIDFDSAVIPLSSPLWCTVIYAVGVVAVSDIFNLKWGWKIGIFSVCAFIWMLFSQLFTFGII